MTYPDPSAGRRRRGFTLIELAIVLTIAGLLFVGLWRLLSGGNQQVRDQAAASQQQQLISAVKAYLGSSAGQTFMGALGPGGIAAIAMPGGACAAGALCNYLPPGFTGATPNSYGQFYAIQVLKDGAPSGTPPTTYSFMVMTTGGDTIPDTSGGRISSFIGGDGGFLYTSPTVCATTLGIAANLAACGAYGTWQLNAQATYGPWPTVPASGHIASRTYVSPTADSQFPWLARQLLLPDPAYSWNTMTTDLYMGGASTQTPPGFGNIYMAPFVAGAPSAAGGSNFYATGGSIFMGPPSGAVTGGGKIFLQGGMIDDSNDAAQTGEIQVSSPAGVPWLGNPLINLLPRCTSDNSPSANPALTYNATCGPGVQVVGDMNISGQMRAFDFYAGSFVYSSSDMRLKSDVRPLADPLTDVMRLKPVSFTYKMTGAKSLGVIAQDVEKVYPQLVSGADGAKAVQYDGLIAPLIGAVQELKQENDRLREELDIQKAEQKKLENELRKNQTP